MFDFSIHHLRFTAAATTPILLDDYKGSALRGAWQGYMQTAYCGAPPTARTDAFHQANCPVCYLTARESGAETRRPYALQPPLSRQPRYDPGERFQFGFTLFGNAHTLFPYVLLAVREMGETQGIGRWLQEIDGRGRYRLVGVEACDPHLGTTQTVWREGDTMAHSPTLAVTAASIAARTAALLAELERGQGIINLHFLTPLRIVHHNRLMHWFTFSFFFQRLLERLYGLAQHFSPGPQRFAREELIAAVQALAPVAEQVQVLGDNTSWWDVKGFSKRTQGETHLGGLAGKVALASDDWPLLLPYLLWGASTQLGKNVVKGGGWYEVELNTIDSAWDNEMTL